MTQPAQPDAEHTPLVGTTVSTPDDAPHKEPSDAEEVYYQGSPPLRGLGMQFVAYLLAAAALIAVPILLTTSGHAIPALYWLIFIGAGVVVACIPAILVKRVSYRVSNYRVDWERGLLSKTIDTLELWHVEDLHYYQSIVDRILGVGSIEILSHDRMMPALTIKGIPHSRPLYETLKQRVIAVKRSRGVMKMDPG